MSTFPITLRHREARYPRLFFTLVTVPPGEAYSPEKDGTPHANGGDYFFGPRAGATVFSCIEHALVMQGMLNSQGELATLAR